MFNYSKVFCAFARFALTSIDSPAQATRARGTDDVSCNFRGSFVRTFLSPPAAIDGAHVSFDDLSWLPADKLARVQLFTLLELQDTAAWRVAPLLLWLLLLLLQLLLLWLLLGVLLLLLRSLLTDIEQVVDGT